MKKEEKERKLSKNEKMMMTFTKTFMMMRTNILARTWVIIIKFITGIKPLYYLLNC